MTKERRIAILTGAAMTLYFADLGWAVEKPIPLPTIRFAAQAEAVIGHPLTPLSYAGVARRTARRTTRRVMRRTAYYMTALPPDCIYGPYFDAYYYNCSGTYYVRDNDAYVQVVFDE